jgi:hypothetical protein
MSNLFTYAFVHDNLSVPDAPVVFELALHGC